jgi:integrase
MAYIRRHRNKWQSIIRITGHPVIAKSFVSKTDAKLWALSIESKIRRDDLGISKIIYPKFKDLAHRYIKEVSPYKKSFIKERYIILALLNESWSKDSINKITPAVISKYRDKYLTKVSGSSVNRTLDVLSTIFTTCKKEWGYPIENPILSIRRPKKAEPRDRRFNEDELSKLIKGNRASPKLRLIIQIALETAMRQGEILRVKPEDINGNTLFIPIAKTKPRTIPLTLKAMSFINNAPLPNNITGNAVSKQFKKLCDPYGLEDAHFHDLRKQSLTNFMLDKKLSVAETMMIAGHSDPRMLLRTYNNLTVEDVAKKLI